MDKEDFVVIIILNYNKKINIIECLDSIFKMDYKNYKVVVVDNGSSDGSVEAIKSKYPNIHLIESKINLGAAGGRNLAIKYTREKLNYDFILFLDNDIIIDKSALSEMIRSFDSKENIGIVTPKCYQMNLSKAIGYAGGLYVNLFTGSIRDIGSGEKDVGQFDRSIFVSACGGLFLIRNNVMNLIGQFDERFNPYGWEDVDYSLRVREHGFKIFYNHKAIVYHKGGKRQRDKISPEYEFSKAKNYFYLLQKHANIFQLIIIGSILPVKVLLIMIKEISRGEYRILLSQLRGILSSFKK